MNGQSLSQLRDRIEIITFDCYGTLVDWETGVRNVIRDIAGSADPHLFDAYLEIEADIESGPYMSYRRVHAETMTRLSRRFGFDLPDDKRHAFSETLPDWPLWPDTNDALKRLKSRYRLGVLSNIDRDLFAGTSAHFDVDIDLLVTAEDVQSYKPAHPHFDRMLEQVDVGPERVLHAAQSLFHDCVPATALGITNVWINRRSEVNTTDAKPVSEFPDLAGLADAMGV